MDWSHPAPYFANRERYRAQPQRPENQPTYNQILTTAQGALDTRGNLDHPFVVTPVIAGNVPVDVRKDWYEEHLKPWVDFLALVITVIVLIWVGQIAGRIVVDAWAASDPGPMLSGTTMMGTLVHCVRPVCRRNGLISSRSHARLCL